MSTARWATTLMASAGLFFKKAAGQCYTVPEVICDTDPVRGV
jgi:hypothetical protein